MAKKADVVKALKAITVLTKWGQWCFQTANGIPMGMSKAQERLVKTAMAAPAPRRTRKAERV